MISYEKEANLKVDEERFTQRKVNGLWEDIKFRELKDGDIFRLFEPDGTPVVDKDIAVFTTTCDAFLNEDNIWTVNIIE